MNAHFALRANALVAIARRFVFIKTEILGGQHNLRARVDSRRCAPGGEIPDAVILCSASPAAAREAFADEVVVVATTELELRRALEEVENAVRERDREEGKKRKAVQELDRERLAPAERSVRSETEARAPQTGPDETVSRELVRQGSELNLTRKQAAAAPPLPLATATDPRRRVKPDSVQLLSALLLLPAEMTLRIAEQALHPQSRDVEEGRLWNQQPSSYPFHLPTRLSYPITPANPTISSIRFPLRIRRIDQLNSSPDTGQDASHRLRKQQH